ncbi:hypothetical protein MJD09_14015 [bacterium]|nr:hypothetical protein [bacterium]
MAPPKCLLLLVTLLIIDTAGSQTTFEFSGYAKDLSIRSSSILTQEDFFLNIGRFRSKGLLSVGGRVDAELWLDTEILAGNFLKTQEFQFRQLIERPTFADLEWTVTDENDYRIEQRLFRAFITFYAGQAEITFGRQRIAWGTGFVWNPTDLLNPFNPAAIELDEKEGVDAGYLALPLGSLSKLELAYAPGRKALKSSTALRIGTNVGNYDLTIMAGDFQDDLVLGSDFAGYLGGAGLRGELAYTWAEDDRNYFKGILNADYSFPNGLYVFVEFYLNGQGATSKGDYDLLSLLSGRTFNLARYYVAASLTKTVTPLLGLNLYNILNLTDGSALIGPALTYSLAANLELAASAYFLTGDEGTEYGQLNSSYFGHLQFYF